MQGWCDRAVEWLKDRGVTISLGEKILSIEDKTDGVTVTTDKQTIEADMVIWANDNVSGLGSALGINFDVNDYKHHTPVIFLTLITQASNIKNFTYIQNFDPQGLTFRTAAAGIYSNQTKENGTSFITCECPASIDSEEWNDPQSIVPAVWEEVKQLGVIKPDAELVDFEAICIPVTFKPALLGYQQKIEQFRDEVSKRSKRTILRNCDSFFRRQVYQDSLDLRKLVA